MTNKSVKNQTYQPTEKLNLVLLVMASLASIFFLWLASTTSALYIIAFSVIGFSLTANTLFSLLHEAVHGLFSSRPLINEWAGRLAAAWFPTSLVIQRAFHLTHHRNNRTPEEQFDVLHEGDIKWLKYAQWYSIISGVYWFVTVLGLVLYLFIPSIFRINILRSKDSKIGVQTSSSAYFTALNNVDPLHAKLEILGSIAFQALLFWGLGLTWWGWLLCYSGFAVYWSSLQYADHAYSELDPVEGAWNLSVSPLTRAIYLNYHYHLAHHQNPNTPWYFLGEHVDPDSFQPSFWKVWMKMWKGPRASSELDKVLK